MSQRYIPLDLIDVAGLIRRPRAARVAAVARSLDEDGQLSPIEVSPQPRGERFALTRGWVRLEAAKSLGWVSLHATVKRTSHAERRKREIEDNLIGDGNTVLDRARYLAAGKALYEAEHPETRDGGARRGDQVANVGHLKPYFGWAAERYGLAERSIRRACTIGEYLDAVAADRLAETPWSDHQLALETLSRLTRVQQQAVAQLLTRDPDPVASLAEAIAEVVGAPPAAPDKKRWSAALSNYASMGTRQRADWLRHLVDDALVPNGVRIVFEGEA